MYRSVPTNESRTPPSTAIPRRDRDGIGKPMVSRPNGTTNKSADNERTLPNKASEVSSRPRLAITCPPPQRAALVTANKIATFMMCLLV
jgi:hypothetical protein